MAEKALLNLLRDKGKFETVTLNGMTFSRATYEPGWKWSEDVGSGIGAAHCTVEQVRMVVSGRAVVGDEPYVSLHFMGAGKYAK
jgi:hypothetical protein